MGYTTKIPDAELERGDPPQKAADFDDGNAVVKKSKVVKPKEEKPPVTTTASTKTAK